MLAVCVGGGSGAGAAAGVAAVGADAGGAEEDAAAAGGAAVFAAGLRVPSISCAHSDYDGTPRQLKRRQAASSQVGEGCHSQM